MSASHPITSPEDLRDLQHLVAKAQGPVRSVSRSYGDELEFAFGLDDQQRGSWLLGTQASPWSLLDPSGKIVVSGRERDGIERLAQQVDGREVSGVEVQPDGLDLIVQLDDGSRLAVEAKSDLGGLASPYPEPPYWEIITPSRIVVAAGPGPGWVRYPADLPESDAPPPGHAWHVDPRMKALVRATAELRWELARVEAATERSDRWMGRIALVIAIVSLIVLIASLAGLGLPTVNLLAAVVSALAASLATSRLSVRVRRTARKPQ